MRLAPSSGRRTYNCIGNLRYLSFIHRKEPSISDKKLSRTWPISAEPDAEVSVAAPKMQI